MADRPAVAQGLQVLRDEYGYELHRVTPVDMFPHTEHAEVIVHLRRMGFLTTVEMPIDWVMDPAVPPSAQPAAVPQATAPKSETTR